jgi:vacuolar-type H+-ATPase subunit H
MDEPRALTAITEIRSLELEMAQRLDEARAEVDAAVACASDQARRTVTDAGERGARQAEECRRSRVDAATDQAEQIRHAGEVNAAELLETLRPRLGELIDEMVEVVLSTSGQDGR